MIITTNERFIRVENQEIFYRLRRGTSNKCIVFLHGYPTSSLDYKAVIETIPDTFNVLAHDHLGFGQSSKPSSSKYLISEQADIALALYKELGLFDIHIVAHDYGTSVATEIVARNNKNEIDISISSVTLCNGSMLIDMAQLRFIQKLLKNKWIGNWVAQLSTEKTFHRNMKNIWFENSAYNKEEMSLHWDLLISKGGRKVLSQITSYIDQRSYFYDRWIGGLSKSKLPFHILWAANDPVAVVAMAYQLNEIIDEASLTIIDSCGHYPMLEKAQEWTDSMIGFIENVTSNTSG